MGGNLMNLANRYQDMDRESLSEDQVGGREKIRRARRSNPYAHARPTGRS